MSIFSDSADSSDDEKSELKKKPASTSANKKIVMKTEVDDANADSFDTEYHKPSELADKQNKKKAMSDLINKRRDKKQGMIRS